MVRMLVGLLGWAGTVLVLAAVAIRFLKPEWQTVGYWLAVAGLGVMLVYMLAQWRDLARLFGRRQARFGALALVSVVVVVGLLAALNYLASRHSTRWDLTAARQFTLSDQTERILQSLSAPIKISVFAREDDFERFRLRLTEYAHESDRVSVEYIDVDKSPARAKAAAVQSYGTVVMEYGGRTERVVSDGEQELTNTLIKVVEGRQPKVYFIQGHGEKNVTSAERDGYNGISEALKNDNYGVETLVLAQQADVPADASVAVLAGPHTDLLPGEVDALRRYLNRGGKLLVMIDPPVKPGDPQLSNILALLREWGIEVGNNVVVDVSGVGQLIGTDASVPVAANYPSHAITERFAVMTAFPLARSVGPVSGGVEGRTAQTFVETSAQSWAETDIAKLAAAGQVALEENRGDKPGPVSIAAAVSATAPEPPAAPADKKEEEQKAAVPPRTPETRVVAVGDSDFAANFALGIQGNRDLFVNMVNWLALQENLIAIRPREPEDRRITLTADQQIRIMWISLVIVPGLVLATGVYTWWRRR